MAAREIKTTLALDGEKQFKAGMSEAYNAMKVLGSELKLNTAQFGKNADSMEGLTKRGEILRKEIDQQKVIVEALKKALKESADAYGETDKRTDEYRIKLNNAEAALAKMNREVADNENAMKDASKATTDWKDKLGVVNEVLDKGISVVGKVTAGIAAFGAAAIATGKQMFDLVGETGKWADELITTSIQTGVSTTALQEWGYAAQFIDTEVETMTGSMAKMVRQLTAAKEGTGASAEAFAALGVNITGANGQLLGSQEIFFAAIDALGKVGNETERDALAMQLFGKSAQELNPLIAAGSDELKRLGQEAQSMGIIIGEDGVTKLGAFDDKMNVFNSTITGMKNNIAVALTPAMEKVVEVIQSVANKFGEWLNSPAAQSLITDLTDKIVNLADNIGDNLDGALNTIIKAFETAGKVIGFVIDNMETITTVIIALTGVLATLKIAQIAVNIAMASNPIGGVIVAIGALVTAIVALIKNWDAVSAAVTRAWEGIKTAVLNGVNAVVGFFGGIFTAIADFPGKMFDIGVDMVEGLWEGIKSMITWLGDKVGGWISGVWKDIKGFFGIASPSKLMANTIGKPIVQGMAKGILDNAGLVDAAMSNLVPSAVHSNVMMDVTRSFSDIANSRPANEKASLVEAIREAMGDQIIVLNDREFGRAVRRAYA